MKYFQAREELQIALKSLEKIYDRLDPKRPRLRTRLVSLANDLVVSSEMCFEAFCSCMPFSFHHASIMSQPEYVAVKLSQFESERYQELFIEKKCLGHELTKSEEGELAVIQNKLNRYGELCNVLFGPDVPREMELTRKRAEDRLKASSRAFLFSCRAFQDALYALMLVSQDQNPGKHSSMSDGVKENGVARKVLGEESPYYDWFIKFKGLRDLAKDGATCSVGLGNINVGVSFDDARNNEFVKVGGNRFRLSDLAVAMHMTAIAIEKTVSEPHRS
ncbi:hypothetical protein N5A93_03420 [Roseovarius sp. EGI FJ00037]|uniref:hypothetical protein n=1 Tax=Roseovarius TaxID=74030 RepID=UPI0022A74106|nr:hypothetical protein [Roseovarius sp. EGI FJ00037]MCZ0811271.1 hypothetical protein [Roseovarius sp. EGI FJ00037]